ncbi:kinase-like protein [Exidia glandulosa HHB12029]|uniref:Kinase-like protein n=1 Tax=Exidia glandulosa HHB12029 TaxID=1314781 RepID=A0A165KGV0_EXIGL|nr:kinase-like protein [Exidia glandulosa HHB12029]
MASSEPSNDLDSALGIDDLDITPDIEHISQRVAFGGMADIHTATWMSADGPLKVAVKIIRTTDSVDSGILRRYRREIALWRGIRHPNLLPFCGLYSGTSALPAMVSPWCDNGDIVHYLRTRQYDPEIAELKLDLLKQVCEGVAHLHQNGIVHADLKGANILISDDGTARVTDFGFSSILLENSKALSLHTSTMGGTFRWMWPPVLTEEARPCAQGDVWSLGCVILEVQSGVVPYNEIPNEIGVIVAMSKNILPSRPDNFPEMLWRIVLACWKVARSASDIAARVESWRRQLSRARTQVLDSTSASWSTRWKPDSVALITQPTRLLVRTDTHFAMWNVDQKIEVPVDAETSILQNEEICAVAVSFDGETIATASRRRVRLWSTASGEELRSSVKIPAFGDMQHFITLSFAPNRDHDDVTIAVGVAVPGKGYVQVMHLRLGNDTKQTFGSTLEFPLAIAFSDDAALVACSSWTSISVWDVATGDTVFSVPHGLTPHHAGLSYPIAFQHRTRVVAASGNGTVKAWDTLTSSPKPTTVFEPPILIPDDDTPCFALSRDGTQLALVGSKIGAHRWPFASAFGISSDADWLSLDEPGGDMQVDATIEGKRPQLIVFSSDGTAVASAYEGGAVRVWYVAEDAEWSFAD